MMPTPGQNKNPPQRQNRNRHGAAGNGNCNNDERNKSITSSRCHRHRSFKKKKSKNRNDRGKKPCYKLICFSVAYLFITKNLVDLIFKPSIYQTNRRYNRDPLDFSIPWDGLSMSSNGDVDSNAEDVSGADNDSLECSHFMSSDDGDGEETSSLDCLTRLDERYKNLQSVLIDPPQEYQTTVRALCDYIAKSTLEKPICRESSIEYQKRLASAKAHRKAIGNHPIIRVAKRRQIRNRKKRNRRKIFSFLFGRRRRLHTTTIDNNDDDSDNNDILEIRKRIKENPQQQQQQINENNEKKEKEDPRQRHQQTSDDNEKDENENPEQQQQQQQQTSDDNEIDKNENPEQQQQMNETNKKEEKENPHKQEQQQQHHQQQAIENIEQEEIFKDQANKLAWSLLISGTPRSGTVAAEKTLTKLGLYVTNDQHFPSVGKGMVSWMHVLYSSTDQYIGGGKLMYGTFQTIIHQRRNVLQSLTSLIYTEPLLDQHYQRFIMGLPYANDLTKAILQSQTHKRTNQERSKQLVGLIMYVEWQLFVIRVSSWSYRLEDLFHRDSDISTSIVNRIFEFANVPEPKRPTKSRVQSIIRAEQQKARRRTRRRLREEEEEQEQEENVKHTTLISSSLSPSALFPSNSTHLGTDSQKRQEQLSTRDGQQQRRRLAHTNARKHRSTLSWDEVFDINSICACKAFVLANYYGYNPLELDKSTKNTATKIFRDCDSTDIGKLFEVCL